MQGRAIACIVGARPKFVKMAALIAELRRRPQVGVELIHTGQHFSPEMSASFFQELELPEPDVNLGAGGGITIEQGTNCLAGTDPDRILCTAQAVLAAPMPAAARPPLWDGQASPLIADILVRPARESAELL